MRHDGGGRRSTLRSEDARKQHRDAWLIVLSVGCAIIILGNLLGIGPWWLASAVAVCMIIYGIGIEVYVDNADVPGDAKGDSIYYLGLLFTFAALVAALISFDWGTTAGAASGTSGSIRNFGIALLTTIVGLAGRVWFTMSHESPGDIADTARSQLEEAVSRMKESLDRARDDLDIMADKFRASSVGMGTMSEIIAESTKRTAETCEALDAYASHISDSTHSLTEDIGQLNAVCGTSARALSALQGHAETLGVRFQDVQAKLADAENVVDRINSVAAPAADRLGATLVAVEGTDDAVAALGESLAGVGWGAERARTSLAGIADTVDGDGVLPTWKASVDQLHEGSRGIQRIGERASAMSAEFDKLQSSMKAARDGLDSVPGAAGHINQQLLDAGPELVASVAPVRERVQGLSANLAAAERQSGELSSALENATRQAHKLSAQMRETPSVPPPVNPTPEPAHVPREIREIASVDLPPEPTKAPVHARRESRESASADPPPEPTKAPAPAPRGVMGRIGLGWKRLTDRRQR